MAERRMISKSISISEKVNSLSLFGRLLYTWMIPHADDFGRLPGSPTKIKALVIPMFEETVKDVESALKDMSACGLILWYTVNGDKYIQINNFEEHQTGLHKRTASKYPDPKQAEEIHGKEHFREFPGNSQKFPLEENRTEQNRREEEITTTKDKDIDLSTEDGLSNEENGGGRGGGSSGSSPSRNVFSFFEENGFGMITSYIAELLNDLVQTYSEEWVLEALKLSVQQGKRKISYAEGILKRWQADGIDTPWKGDKRNAANRNAIRGDPRETEEIETGGYYNSIPGLIKSV